MGFSAIRHAKWTVFHLKLNMKNFKKGFQSPDGPLDFSSKPYGWKILEEPVDKNSENHAPKFGKKLSPQTNC